MTELLKNLRAVRAHLPADFVSLTSFNDNPTTTHADIIALIDRAIATEEKEIV